MNEMEQRAIAVPERCVVIVSQALDAGRAANAAAVMALTLGQRYPGLVGEALVDARQRAWPGLIPIGIPVLAADTRHLQRLWQEGASQALDVVLFPVEGQATTDYTQFRAALADQNSESFQLIGIAIAGDKKRVRKLTSGLALYCGPVGGA